LHGKAHPLIAADDFQNRNLTGESPAAAWLHELNVRQELKVNHRTAPYIRLSAARYPRRIDTRHARVLTSSRQTPLEAASTHHPGS
jgi:hypothetical protein